MLFLILGAVVVAQGIFLAWNPRQLFDPERRKKGPLSWLGPPPPWFFVVARGFGILFIAVGTWVVTWGFQP